MKRQSSQLNTMIHQCDSVAQLYLLSSDSPLENVSGKIITVPQVGKSDYVVHGL